MDTDHQLKPATARKVFLWQMTMLAILLAAVAACPGPPGPLEAARDDSPARAWTWVTEYPCFPVIAVSVSW